MTSAQHLRTVEHFQSMLDAFGFKVWGTRDNHIVLTIAPGKWKGVVEDTQLVTFDTVEECIAWMRGIDFFSMYVRHGKGPECQPAKPAKKKSKRSSTPKATAASARRSSRTKTR